MNLKLIQLPNCGKYHRSVSRRALIIEGMPVNWTKVVIQPVKLTLERGDGLKDLQSESDVIRSGRSDQVWRGPLRWSTGDRRVCEFRHFSFQLRNVVPHVAELCKPMKLLKWKKILLLTILHIHFKRYFSLAQWMLFSKLNMTK